MHTNIYTIIHISHAYIHMSSSHLVRELLLLTQILDSELLLLTQILGSELLLLTQILGSELLLLTQILGSIICKLFATFQLIHELHTCTHTQNAKIHARVTLKPHVVRGLRVLIQILGSIFCKLFVIFQLIH